MGLFGRILGGSNSPQSTFDSGPLEKKANSGDYDACIELAEYYYSDDVDDLENAEKWFLKAFEMKPEARTAYRIAYCKARDGVVDSYDWLVKSEELGYEDATASLDSMCGDPTIALNYSIEKGRKIDDYCVMRSREEGYPFWAEEDHELDKMRQMTVIDTPLFIKSDTEYELTSYPPALITGIADYSLSEYSGHPVKLRYIMSVLKQRAQSGDYRAMAVLASNLPINVGLVDRSIADTYKAEIESGAKSGNPEALFAKGHLADMHSKERCDALLESAKKGNADAAFMFRWDAINTYQDKTGRYPDYESEKELFELGANGSYGVTLEYMRQTLSDDFSTPSSVPVIPLGEFINKYE